MPHLHDVRMQRPPSVVLAVALAAVAAAASALTASTSSAVATPPPTRWVTQVGTYDYLLQPDYTGLLPLRDVVGNATLGLGTFDHLDGELVLMGGTVYRVGTDGTPRPADLDTTTPFFEAVKFAPQATMTLPAGTACSALQPYVDQLAGTSNGMVALRLTGTFTALTARSVPRQEQPYLPLADVVATQTVFPLDGSRATLVGFRTGTNLKGVGAPGVHIHGLTTDRGAGGHILSCTTGADVRMSIQVTRGARVYGN